MRKYKLTIKSFALILLSMLILLSFCCIDSFSLENKYIYINEICADVDENCALHRAYDDVAEDGYYDWIELYNCSDDAISLNGYYLTNKNTKLTKYALPDVSLPAYGFIIIYAGDEPASPNLGEYFTGFSISKKSEDIYLTDGENIIDTININKALTNMSISRYPDGGDEINEVEATPRVANKRFIKEPTFSHESGFFDNPIYLSISSDADDVDVYYTTDGTEPTICSNKYDGSIQINDASLRDNILSARKDISPYLYNGAPNNLAEIQSGYAVPNSKVDKSNIIKAVCIDSRGNKSKVAVAEYFVSLRNRGTYTNIPVISLVTDYSELFDSVSGIYVFGEKYSTFKKSGKKGETIPAYWDANYQSDTEIKSLITKYDVGSGSKVSDIADIRIKGQSTRALPQKSFYIKCDDLDCQLSNGGNDDFYKLNDAITDKISDGLNLEHSNFQPCQVFLNGEYWGMYHVGDRLFTKKHYADKYGISKDSIAIIKNNELNEGKQKDLDDYNDIIEFVVNNNMLNNSNYNTVEEKIDMNSLIDYYIIEMFVNNTDWPGNNIAVWRSTELDAKWRYILFDTNFYTLLKKADKNMFVYVMNSDPFFKSLYSNAEFKNKFKTRLNELLSSNLDSTVTVPAARSIETVQKIYAKCNADRFFEGIDFRIYDVRCNTINTFLAERGDKLKSFVENYVPNGNNGGGSSGGGAGEDVNEPSKESSSAASSNASAESTMPGQIKLLPPTIKKMVSGQKSFTIKWKKVPSADGYRLQYSTTKNFEKGTRKTITISRKRTNYTVGKLKPGKKYYIRLRSYRVVGGKKLYSKWSNVKNNL